MMMMMMMMMMMRRRRRRRKGLLELVMEVTTSTGVTRSSVTEQREDRGLSS